MRTAGTSILTRSMSHQFARDTSNNSTDDFIGLKNDGLENTNKHFEPKVSKYIMKKFNKLVVSEGFRKLQQRSEPDSQIVQLRHSQVELGEVLGEGSFSDVFEIKRSLSDDIRPDQLVVKVLRKRVLDNPSLFAGCAVGLAKEGAILASLNHKHLIQVRAYSQGGVSTYATGRNDAFFIVLDRLDEILSDRLVRWVERANNLRFRIRRRHQKSEEFFNKRLQVAKNLADALSYLHQNNIIHRDVKPSNVGFDCDGTLKLFDFDVSRILPEDSFADERFKLTQATGTRRYMSPECGLGETYNRKTDVYSFAILLHEILSLQHPFHQINKLDHADSVFKGGLRPQIHASWPKQIQVLLKQAWSRDIRCRPSMSEIHQTLTQELSGPKTSTKRISFGMRFSSKVSAVGLEDCMNQ